MQRLLAPLSALTVTVLGPAALLMPTTVQAQSLSYSSRISEVDACIRAQAQLPEGAIVTGMRVSQTNNAQGYGFTCRVRWSTSPKAQPTRMPILFGPVWS